MKNYYMNKEMGNLVKFEEIFFDAEECGYDDITDPCSCEYGMWWIHYSKTNYTYDEAE